MSAFGIFWPNRYFIIVFFTVRAMNDWNSLPNHVVNAPTINDFKNALDSSWSAMFSDY